MKLFLWGLSGMCALALASACGSDEEKGGGNGGGGPSCVPKAAECYLSGPSGPGAECLAKHDNAGSDVWQGRITQINIKGPPILAQKFAQENIVDVGVSLNQPSCFEYGEGTFSWLFEFNKTTGKLRTGGGLPVNDPAAGGCFVTLTSTSLPIKPIEVDVSFEADGRGFSATGIDVFVPIFDSVSNTDNPIILPLHQVELKGTWNSDAHNCIGKFNGEVLSPATECRPFYDDGERSWTTGATLKGYISIQEADQVVIEDVGSTLCAYIAGLSEWNGPQKNCASSDKWVNGERPEGDWCAATNSAATPSCKDAWLLEGDFSAAAFKINGDCP